MNVTEAIRKRRSIRKFKEGVQIPREEINTMLEAAMMAPSANNTRPWEFIVVQNRERMEKIMGFQKYSQMLKTASVAIIICGRPDLQTGNCVGFWPLDCGAATENLLLQAEDLGYGACWCGAYPTDSTVKDAQELFQISSVPCAIIAVGVPEESPAARGSFDEKRVTYID